MLNFLKQLEGRKYRDYIDSECLVESVFIDEDTLELCFTVKTFRFDGQTFVDILNAKEFFDEEFKEWL